MSSLLTLIDTYKSFISDSSLINLIFHFLQVPILLVIIIAGAAWIVHMIFSLTPVGLALNTEAVWTTLISPFLVVGYPAAAVNIAAGGNTECMKVSKMLENREAYSTMEFVTQLAMKENRLTAPFLIGPSVFLKSLASAAGISWDSKGIVVLE